MEYTFYTETKLTPVASSFSAAASRGESSSSSSGGPLRGNMAPKFVICYICGRKYGTQSITIHEKTCLEKFRRDNEALPANLRRTEPKRPQAMQGVLVEQTIIGVGAQRGNAEANLDKLNQEALSSFQGTLVACPNCDRKFLPDRLEVHQRACNSLGGETFKHKRGAGGNASSKGKAPYQVRLVKRDPGTLEAEAAAKQAEFNATNQEQGAFVTCKMCGKAFMGHSLAIHQAQCVKHAASRGPPPGRGGAKNRGGGGGARPMDNNGPSRRAGPSGFGGGGGMPGSSRQTPSGPSGNNAAFRPGGR